MSNQNSRGDIWRYIELVRRYNEEKTRETGKPPVSYTRTFGCQQNVSDSEKIKGMLAEMGYLAAPSPEQADLILFNTCAVRENAEERVFGNVGALKAQKESHRDLIIGLCGCMTQQPHISRRIRESYPYVDLVFGTHALGRLPELLWKKLSEGGRLTDIAEGEGDLREDLPTRRDGTVRAWVPIMYGCDNFCTYCVVPLVRGRERSRELAAVTDEVRQLVSEGFREINLLGQNVNSYGKTLAQPVDFSHLLREIDAIPGDFRIRFMTCHPKDCTRELIDTIVACDKVCGHIHLPVQSGSTSILRAMNRRYTPEQYISLIDYAREKIPGVSFTSDILVGFPGETEEDFAATLALVERVRYHSLFTFLYSRREGTKAASLADTATREELLLRFDRLIEAQRRIGQEHYRAMMGQVFRVLVEGTGKTGENRLTGKTEQGVIAEFDGDKSLIGSFVRVRVTQPLLWAVIGEIVS